MLKRPSYLGSARGGTCDEPGPRGLAGRRASGRDPGAAPVPSPLARHSRGEAFKLAFDIGITMWTVIFAFEFL